MIGKIYPKGGKKPASAVPGTGHLRQPVVVAAVAPVLGLVAARHAEHADLVTLPVQILGEREKFSHTGHSHFNFFANSRQKFVCKVL